MSSGVTRSIVLLLWLVPLCRAEPTTQPTTSTHFVDPAGLVSLDIPAPLSYAGMASDPTHVAEFRFQELDAQQGARGIIIRRVPIAPLLRGERPSIAKFVDNLNWNVREQSDSMQSEEIRLGDLTAIATRHNYHVAGRTDYVQTARAFRDNDTMLEITHFLIRPTPERITVARREFDTAIRSVQIPAAPKRVKPDPVAQTERVTAPQLGFSFARTSEWELKPGAVDDVRLSKGKLQLHAWWSPGRKNLTAAQSANLAIDASVDVFRRQKDARVREVMREPIMLADQPALRFQYRITDADNQSTRIVGVSGVQGDSTVCVCVTGDDASLPEMQRTLDLAISTFRGESKAPLPSRRERPSHGGVGPPILN